MKKRETLLEKFCCFLVLQQNRTQWNCDRRLRRNIESYGPIAPNV